MNIIRLLLFLMLLNIGYSLLVPFSDYKITTNFVSSHGIKIENVDIESFQIIDEALAKDKNNIYLGTEIIKNVDVKTFRKIEGINGSLYYRDKYNIYFLEINGLVKINNAHLESFVVYDSITARDKNTRYFRATKITNKNTIKDWEKRAGSIQNGIFLPL